MKLIYWNTHGFKEFEVYKELLIDYSPDIFFTSETNEDLFLDLSSTFESVGYVHIENPGCERIKIFIRNNLTCDLGIQSKFYSTIIVNDITIISVHFPSQMNHHMDALRNNLRRFRNIIDEEIGSSTEKSILVIGDVNVNPYEPAMINFDGFMATNSISARKSIKSIDDERREPYYNATWRLYSDNIFPGTKKFPRPSGSSYDIIEFHLLDQVLTSFKFREIIESDEISIITKTSNYNLLNNKTYKNKKIYKIDYSDHLPLFYKFKLN